MLAGLAAVLLVSPAARAQDASPPPANPPAAGETSTTPPVGTDPAKPAVDPSPAEPQQAPADDGGVEAGDPPANASNPAVQGETPEAAGPASGQAAPADPAASGVAAPDGGRVGNEAPAATDAAPAEAVSPADPASDAKPTPSLLDDPAGALSHMLAPTERDPNLPHNLSPVGMFMNADVVVKAVMIGLAFASLVTWTVWIAKSLELAGAKVRLRRVLKSIVAADSLGEASRALGRRSDPGTLLVRAAEHEMRRSEGALDHAGGQGLLQRVTSHLSRIEAQAGRRMTRGTGVLATIGSTAPFVGLFGTVWGIMNSFIGISEAQTTNLAVVAPGIAEALLATALGLVAAIPAVVIYNVFARGITGYRQLLADASAAVERLVSRDLDYRRVPVPASPAQPQAAE